MAQGTGKKTFVGLSGGVDSALSAALLKEQGYEVTGVFIETWHPDFLPCTWKDDRIEAMRAAAHLNIPFVSLNLSEKYQKEVGEYFIEEYRKGRTPNPDVLCNRSIKFGGFTDFARAQGADFVATGHYAQVHHAGGRHYLKKGKDLSKDQSYFLWMLDERDLAYTLFPVGHLTKEQVRTEALKRGLPQAARKDSQGICFLGAVDLPEFLSKFIPLEEGRLLDEGGRDIGTHKGAAVYTVGERHGFSVKDPSMRSEPLYVHKINVLDNTVTVGPLAHVPKVSEVLLSSVVLTDRASQEGTVGVLRYHGTPVECTLSKQAGGYHALFAAPVQVAAGQSLVVYQNEIIVGGGIVEFL